eukprot:jgi/Chlat1/3759/Chrsp259S03940
MTTRGASAACGAFFRAAQAISAVLLYRMHDARQHAHFWRSRLQEGGTRAHMHFYLLNNGPLSFVRTAAEIVRRSYTRLVQRLSQNHHHVQHVIKSTDDTALVALLAHARALDNLVARIAHAIASVHEVADGVAVEVMIGLAGGRAGAVRRAVGDALITLDGVLEELRGHRDNNNTNNSNNNIINVHRNPTVAFTDDVLAAALDDINAALEDVDEAVCDQIREHARPHALKRNWIQYTAGGVAVVYAASWLVKHSRLGGSDDIDRWLRTSKEAFRAFFKEHVAEPLDAIKGELFHTFGARQGIVGREELEESRESLQRMLDDYARDNGGLVGGNGGGGGAGEEGDKMVMLMRRYEDELRHPVRNLIGGDLARAMLIQVQKVKVETESALLAMDQILRANQFNFAILAAVPAALVAFVILALASRPLRTRSNAVKDRATGRLRMRLSRIEAERSIQEDVLALASPRVALAQKEPLVAAMARTYATLAPHANSSRILPSITR